jgi:hypothetical protein
MERTAMGMEEEMPTRGNPQLDLNSTYCLLD